MTPEIEPSLFGRFVDWAVTGVGALCATCWGFLKADIRRIDEANNKALGHIEKLFHAAETDRAKTRDMIDEAKDNLSQTMQINQREIMHAITDISKRCVK